MIFRYNVIKVLPLQSLIFNLQFSIFILLSLLFASCSLDEHPRDQIPEEDAYTTPEEIYKNTVLTLYNYIGGQEEGEGLQGTCRGVYDLQTFGSDEAMLPTRGGDWYDGNLWQDMYRHSWGPGLELAGRAWVYLYKVIALCNNSLEQLEAHKNVLSSVQMREYRAEVRGLRAIYYWYLLDLFGRVPVIYSYNMPIEMVQQAERSKVFEYVYNELMTVRDDLPYGHSANRGEFYGRITRSVVNFVLAKLALNAEVYADDDWTDGVRMNGSELYFNILGQQLNAWQTAVFFCDEIEEENFNLEQDYSNNFIVYNESSTENIWVIPMDKDLYTAQQQNLIRSYHYRHAAAYGFTGENGSCATLHTLRVFGYDTEDEDSRFFLNYWDGEVLDLDYRQVLDREGKVLVYYPWQVEMDLSGSPYVETAGARMKKYQVDRNAILDGKLMDNDIVLFRYADVLLMRAEAYLRKKKKKKGQADFDEVRQRAYMNPRPLTLDNIYDERLLELCWEGWRRQDMIRFGKYESLFEGDEFDDKVDESDGHTTVYPIPSSVLALNKYLQQNKGY